MMKTSSPSVLIASVAVDSYIISKITSTGGAKGLDREYIAFFHALICSSFDKGDLFLAMDLVAQNIVASDGPNRFDWDCLSVELDFVTLHYFLDCFTNVVNPSIDASFLGDSFSLESDTQDKFVYLESSIGSCFDSHKQVIIDRIGSHCKSTIDNPAVDMDSKIHFQDIIVLEDDLLGTGIGSPVSSYVVQAEPGWKSHASFESISVPKALVFSQCSNAILDLLGKLAHGNAGLCDRPRILADLAMDFGSFAIVIQKLIVHVAQYGLVTQVFSRGALKVVSVSDIFDNFTFRISLVVNEAGERDPRRNCLLPAGLLLSFFLVALSFLLLAFLG